MGRDDSEMPGFAAVITQDNEVAIIAKVKHPATLSGSGCQGDFANSWNLTTSLTVSFVSRRDMLL